MARASPHDRPDGKAARLEARITAAQKALFQRAAAVTGRSVSDFVISSAQEAAVRTLREHEVMALSARDSEAFVAALLGADEPGPRLRQAAQRYRKVLNR
jgi:uncharacterized protein (DUF1778 family)